MVGKLPIFKEVITPKNPTKRNNNLERYSSNCVAILTAAVLTVIGTPAVESGLLELITLKFCALGKNQVVSTQPNRKKCVCVSVRWCACKRVWVWYWCALVNNTAKKPSIMRKRTMLFGPFENIPFNPVSPVLPLLTKNVMHPTSSTSQERRLDVQVPPPDPS